jgi:16S rRNA processing protein RimM
VSPSDQSTTSTSPESASGDLLVVGQIGRAHGVRGDVSVAPRTDDPQERFAAGVVLRTDPIGAGPLTVQDSWMHSGRLIVHFVGVDDRNGVEALRGTQLLVARTELPPLVDPDDFYDSDLVGLRAIDPDGAALGTVSEVIHAPGSDLLALQHEGREHLVPFVRQIVPEVDLSAGTVTIVAPDGLFDL